MAIPCKICECTAPHELFKVQDLHFAAGETFDYFLCPTCECLQILEIPEDLGAFYGPDYYAFSRGNTSRSTLRQWLIKRRDQFELKGRGLLGRALAALVPELGLRSLRDLGLDTDSRLLEIGCGNGELLLRLASLGFQNLIGVDPYLPDTDEETTGIQLYQSFEEVEGPFDLIMLHHSFEHMPNPSALLMALHPLLTAEGQLLLRVPLSSSFAFEHYRAHWIQIDAPRHLFLHSEKSLRLLLESTGFTLTRAWHDSTGFQFWGSEQALRGIPLRDPDSVAVKGFRSPFFSLFERIRFEHEAQQLNLSGRGDQGVFLARRASPSA